MRRFMGTTGLIAAAVLCSSLAGCKKESGPAWPPEEKVQPQDSPEARAAPAPAPAQQAQGAPPPGGVPAGEVTDALLSDFAEAYVEVQAVQQQFESRLAGVESPEQAREIQQEAIGAIREKVESTGMEFDTYALVASRLQTDPELRGRLQEILAN